MGQLREADATYKEIMTLDTQLDTNDGRILLLLSQLWLRLIKPGHGTGEIAKRIRSMARSLREDHLALDAQAFL